MSLQQLPVELFQAILCEAIQQRGIKRALRLRLVSRVFADEIINTLYAYRLLDDYFKSLWDLPGDKARLHWPPFTEAYLEYRVLNEPLNGYPALLWVRQVAEEICQENRPEDIDPDAYRKQVDDRVKSLCRLALDGPSSKGDDARKMGNMFKDEVPWNESHYSDHLGAAAVDANAISIVERVIAKYDRAPRYSWLFGQPIRIAAQRGYHDILELLLKDREPGYDFSMLRNKAFIMASRAGRPETVQFIFNFRRQELPWRFEGKENSGTYDQPLSAAMSTPSNEALAAVVEIQKAHSVKKPIWQDEADSLATRLHNAVKEGWTEMARRLIQEGAQPNGRGKDFDSDYRPIIFACQAGNAEIVRLLLDAGADTKRAIPHAARHGQLEIVRMLLEAGAEIKDGLAKAAVGGYMDIVRLLIDRGADVNDINARIHPLVSAVALEHTEMFKYLIEKGAEWHTDDKIGRQCSKIAEEQHLDSMMTLLKEFGTPTPIPTIPKEPEESEPKAEPELNEKQ